MDLNHILLLIALLSPIVLIIRSQRAANLNRGLRGAAFGVLIVTGAAWFFLPRVAGFIGGGAWFVGLAIPAIASHKLTDLALREQFTAARRLAWFLNLIQPAAAVRDQSLLLRALESAKRGNTSGALQPLHSLQSRTGTIALQAVAQSFRLRRDWEGLLAWCRSSVTAMALQRSGILFLYLRALGETGRIDPLILQVTAHAQATLAESAQKGALALVRGNAVSSVSDNLPLLLLWAFTGRKAQLVRLLETALRQFATERKSFWLATAELAAGNIDAGKQQLHRLHGATTNAILRSEIQARLQHAKEYARAVASCTSESDRVLRQVETQAMRKMRYAGRTSRATPVVVTLIVLNVAMFLLEVVAGGSTNPLVLHRLGQLETWNFFASGHYWRLLTSLFLHYGPIHLLFNIYALYVLGPALEDWIGPLRFIACYLISGIGSGLGVVLLHVIGVTPAQDVVGASGCIMGIVGAWAGFLLRYRHLPLARRRLQNIVFIVVIQTVFDISTPQISMAAHMCGLITGFVVGLILAPRDVRAT